MAGPTDTVRVFVSVGLSAAAREVLVDAVERIRVEIPDGVQWARPDGMHLTLKFLGNISSANVPPLLECVRELAGANRGFGLKLTGLGMFPNRRKPRVLWAGVGGELDALSSLQQAAEDAINALGYPPEQRPFRPHITLGRPRRSVSDAQLARIGAVASGLAPPNPVDWQVDSMDVMRSELHPSGAHYTVLGSGRLQPPLPTREG